MAKNRIKGITIEINGDTTQLQKSLKQVDSALSKTQNNLKDINRLLKLNPGNTELLKQKQDQLNSAINDTKTRLKALNDAYANIKGDPEEVKEQQEALKREIIETENKLKSLKKEMSDFGSVAKQKLIAAGDAMQDVGDKMSSVGKDLTMKLSAPILAAGAIGVNYNAEVEQLQVMFTTLTGSAEEADRIISQLQQDAQKSPFDSKTLIKANQYLISAGVNADEARQTILDLGNAIAATGGGSDELDRMAMNLQQIQNVGKASAQDIKQFANAGINIYGLLADSMGVTVEQVKEMDISYDVLSKALRKASKEGGKYYNAMAKQSETMTGSLSALKESVQVLLGEITKSAMPVITQIIGKIREVVTWFSSLDDAQKATILKIAAVVAAAGPAILVAGKVVSALGLLVKGIGALSNPIGLAIAAGTLLIANWDKIKNGCSALLSKVKSDWKQITDFVSTQVQKLKNFFNFKWELPKIKLPHFFNSGNTGPLGLPKIEVAWYSKAMKNGFILDNPTIFGASDGKLLGAGEAGSELIIGTNSLMDMISKASGGTTINMTVNGGNISANELADIVVDKLTTTIKRNNQRW